MFTSGLIYIGVLIRFLYHKFILRERTTLYETWEKTKFNQNLSELKLTNQSLGFIFSVFVTILIIVFFKLL